MVPRIALALLVLAAVGDAAETVRICTRTANQVTALLFSQAEFVTSRILADAGIALDWHHVSSRLCKDRTGAEVILIELAEGTRYSDREALAYTYPYGARHIVILFERIRARTSYSDQTVALLAHVMAHELTHVLQKISRHSPKGVMKERWSRADLAQMRVEPLTLSAHDIELIQHARQVRRVATAP